MIQIKLKRSKLFYKSLEEKKAKEALKPKKAEAFKPWKVDLNDPPAPAAKKETTKPKNASPEKHIDKKTPLKKGSSLKKPVGKITVKKEEPE